jgi:hypothetical protein
MTRQRGEGRSSVSSHLPLQSRIQPNFWHGRAACRFSRIMAGTIHNVVRLAIIQRDFVNCPTALYLHTINANRYHSKMSQLYPTRSVNLEGENGTSLAGHSRRNLGRTKQRVAVRGRRRRQGADGSVVDATTKDNIVDSHGTIEQVSTFELLYHITVVFLPSSLRVTASNGDRRVLKHGALNKNLRAHAGVDRSLGHAEQGQHSFQQASSRGTHFS